MLLMALVVLLSAGCSTQPAVSLAAVAPTPAPTPPWQGMWNGKSIIWEKVMDDAVRKLKRRSEADFWFVVDAKGQAHGEGFISYKAELKAIKWKIPMPTGGEIEAEVEGSSEKEIRKFSLRGTVTEGKSGALDLSLEAMGDNNGKPAPEEDGTIPGITFNFGIEASVVVPAGKGGGALPGAQPGIFSIPIPAKGWSPFQGLHPKIEGGPPEPLRATAEKKGEKFYILWYAIRQSS